MKKQYLPKCATAKFNCPHCDVYAKQHWSYLHASGDIYSVKGGYGHITKQSRLAGIVINRSFNLPEVWCIAVCEHCNEISVWNNEKMIFPKKILVEQPNNDLSKDIQRDYLEAALVLSDSPRSAAAILRLALQKLCKQLGEKGENINDDIGKLVKRGLNPNIQKSLDALRIAGNNAIHPGELDLSDDLPRVRKLFDLINFIADKMITEPNEINNLYEDLPEGAKEAVNKRDKK